MSERKRAEEVARKFIICTHHPVVSCNCENLILELAEALLQFSKEESERAVATKADRQVSLSKQGQRIKELEAENSRLKERHTMSANADKVMEYVEKLEAENAELKKKETEWANAFDRLSYNEKDIVSFQRQDAQMRSHMNGKIKRLEAELLTLDDNRKCTGCLGSSVTHTCNLGVRFSGLEAELAEARKLTEKDYLRKEYVNLVAKHKELQAQLDEANKSRGYLANLCCEKNDRYEELQAQVEQLTKELSEEVSKHADLCKEYLAQGDKMRELTKENESLRNDYEGACKTVAEMHREAVGEVTGPKRGVVEDVTDVIAAKDSHLKLAIEALDRIIGMCGKVNRCQCGRPTGVPALVVCATKALEEIRGKAAGNEINGQ